MPGVAHILTYRNAPAPVVTKGGPAPATGTTPRGNRLIPPALSRELNLQGEVVAIVAAETEDLADDAIAAIKVEYEVLPFVSTLKDVMAPGAPDLRGGKGNLIRTWTSEGGDVERGFAEADVVKEFEYHFAGRGLGADAAERQRGEVGRRPVDDLGDGPGHLSGARRAGRHAWGWIRPRFASSTSGTDRRSARAGSPPSGSIRSSRTWRK